MTPDNPEDAERLRTRRGQGTGGTGLDALPSEQDDALGDAGGSRSGGREQAEGPVQ